MPKDNNSKQEGEQIPKAVIVVGIILILAAIGSVSGGSSSDGRFDRESPDGTGWYKDSGLTNAQVIEINAFCSENPDSWKCK